MTAVVTTNLAAEEKDNFLVPNGTIIVEVIIFAVVLYIMWRFIVPPIRQAMAQRNEMVRRGLDEGRAAEEKFAAAEARHREALNEARAEAAKIRDSARADGQRILDELREQASTEVAELRRQGAEQLAEQREQILGELQPQVRELAGALAGRVVGSNVAAGRRKR